MKANAWPLIRKRKNPGGSFAWMVDCGMVNGKRTRYIFASKQAADTKGQQLRVQRVNEGKSALSISAPDRIDAEAALAILKPLGKTLREAAEFFSLHVEIVDRKMLIEELVRELLENKKRDGASYRYLKDLKTRLGIFAAAFPAHEVIAFSSAQLDDWLRALPVGGVTRNNYRRLLGVLFNYALNRGYRLTNPVKATSRAKEIDKPPGILLVDQSERLLESATPDIVPALALGLFAGLRPESEVWKLDWSSIDFESRLIDVAADRTKTAKKRFVKIADNLVQWLLPFYQKSGPISPVGDAYFTRLQKARTAAKIHSWPADCLRHTFGSMHYAHHQNLGESMAEMGHTNPQTFLKHYRERVKPKDAARYWQILPPSAPGKVVPMVAAPGT
ncbi:MAG: tyrosine-type recombinase/integrase [Chthoniobacter sp.]|uniref:tyrosine-type recombinase/integrase n=1 Tax=Chthoniobacter sp. TaxID=2510640 RepID=UPI0032A893D0